MRARLLAYQHQFLKSVTSRCVHLNRKSSEFYISPPTLKQPKKRSSCPMVLNNNMGPGYELTEKCARYVKLCAVQNSVILSKLTIAPQPRSTTSLTASMTIVHI